jgi:hypothetical protein
MKKLMIAGMACLLLAGIVSLATASGNRSGPLTGTWECVSHDNQGGDMNFTLKLKQNGERVTGVISAPGADLVFKSGAFKDNRLEMVIESEDSSYKAEATYKDGKLSGTWTGADSSRKGTWEGKKSRESAP